MVGFVYPVFAEASSTIDLQGFAHPSLQEPRVNSLAFREGGTGMVLTGSNMAGKSTLLRAVGLCVYLAHLGFPVPALKMTLPPLSGVLTTINLPDNPADGLSHFAQEIKRLEQIMPHLKQGRRLLLLFDELFKGTNAAGAHASTVAVLERLSHFPESYFIVSTHVAGLQSALRKNEVLHFKKMETTFVAGQPVHSYQLVDGVCEDPIGFRLLQRSGVLGEQD